MEKPGSNLLLLNLVPVLIIHLGLTPFWFSIPEDVALFEFIANIVLLPFLLAMINYRHSVSHHRANFFPNILIMEASVFLGSVLHYLNWSRWKLDLHPDLETTGVMVFDQEASFLAVLCFGLLAWAALAVRNRSKWEKAGRH